MINIGISDLSVESLSKAETLSLPIATLFNIPIIVPNTAVDVRKAINEIRNDVKLGHCMFRDRSGMNFNAIGFDTERKPNFRSGEKQNPVELIQIATRKRVVLFHFKKCGFGREILDLLQDTNLLKVG